MATPSFARAGGERRYDGHCATVVCASCDDGDRVRCARVCASTDRLHSYVSLRQGLQIIMTASLLDVLHYQLIYFLVFEIHLHSVGYLISQRPLAFLTSSKRPTQQTRLLPLLAIPISKAGVNTGSSQENVERTLLL